MAGADSARSPLKTAAGVAGPEATEAFELLSNDTRLAILLALWEAYEPDEAVNAVPFSELRERVGTRDSGQFNYHLGKLEGKYVDKHEAGYSLRPLGLKLVGTVIAGAGQTEPFEPVEIDMPCSICGAGTAIRYEDGWFYHVCTECAGGLGDVDRYPRGALFAEPFPPAALENRSTGELFAAAVFRLRQVMAMKLGGLCPRCSGTIEETLSVCHDHEDDTDGVCATCGYTTPARLKWVCTVCKYTGGTSPAGALIAHPAVVSFYYDHGVDVGSGVGDFEGAKEIMTLIRNHRQTVLSTDPVRIRVVVPYDGEELRLTLDGSMNVLETERTG